MRRYALLAAVAALALVIAGPASAYVIDDSTGDTPEQISVEPTPAPTEGEIVVEPTPAPTIAPPAFRTEQVYFHCSEPTPAANANLAAEEAIPGWDTNPPAGSVTDGNGCVTADVNGVAVVVEPQENPTDGVWRGNFTGNLKDLTVELHCFMCVGTARADGLGTVGVRLAIDGEPRTGTGEDSHEVTVEEANSGATQIYTFSITGINLIEPNTDADGDGVGDNPTGSLEHTLTLTVDGYGFDTNTFGFWAYDVDEAPSGITFNPSTLASTRIQAG